MKIAMLTESLGSGGAERQVCTLAGEFKRRGHLVCVATCRRDDFYLPLLEREDIEYRFLGGRGKLSWALNVRRFLRSYKQDVVLAFLGAQSAYAELAGLPMRAWGLVVSERSTGVADRSWFKMYLHTRADYVTVNSHSARIAIERSSPRLRPKLITVYNAVRAEVPVPALQAPEDPRRINLIVAARVDQNKNAMGLLSALKALRDSEPKMRVEVDWYGNQDTEPDVVREVRNGIVSTGLESAFRLHPAADGIHGIMSGADAVALPSFHEGLPNSVCEAMALGKPVLTSDVCDARNLVEEGVNGFLFDPYFPRSVADAIARFAALSPEERARMGRASRARAEKLFDVNTVVGHYLRILEAAAARKTIKIEHWPLEANAEDHA